MMRGLGMFHVIVCTFLYSHVAAQDSETVRIVKMEGETAILPCTFPNHQSYQVEWSRADGIILTIGAYTWIEDNRIRVHPSDAQWNLVISDVTLRDSGGYECQSTQQSLGSVQTELVVEAAPSLVRWQETVPKARGADVTLTCQVTGNPLPDVGWITPDGQFLRPNSRMDEQRYSTTNIDQYQVTSELHVRNLQSEDFGFYKCDAVNSVGSLRRSVKVTKGGP